VRSAQVRIKNIVPGDDGLNLQSSERPVSEEEVAHAGPELALLKMVAARVAHRLSEGGLAPKAPNLSHLIPGAERLVVFVFNADTRRLHPEVAVNLTEEFIPVLNYHEDKRRLLTMAVEQADPLLLFNIPGNKQFSFIWRLAHREDIRALWLVPWRDRDSHLLGALLFALSQTRSPDKQALAAITLLTDWMTMALHEAQAQLDNNIRISDIDGIAGIDHVLSELARWHRDKTLGSLSSREHRKQPEPDAISVLSHELLSPLTLIKGYAATLLQLGEDISEEQKKQYLRGIESAGNKLADLLENFRDISRIEAGTLNLVVEPTSLPDLLRKTISETQNQTTKHIIKLRLARPLPRVNIDRRKMEQLMTNLLGNAMKYSPQGGEIEVSVRQARDEDELEEALGEPPLAALPCLIVSIIDSGIGIPEEDLNKIFHKFYRVDNRLTRTTSGAGLGLYICKIIVEAHGGHIWVESKVDEGSTFHFSLPVV
jgi:signal transduction histidine kinase